MGDTDRLVLAKPPGTLRAVANRRESLSTLAQRGTLGSHLAGLATTSRSHHFLCLSSLSVAVVLAAQPDNRAHQFPVTSGSGTFKIYLECGLLETCIHGRIDMNSIKNVIDCEVVLHGQRQLAQ